MTHLTRRTFVKLTAASTAAFASTYLLGCSSGTGAAPAGQGAPDLNATGAGAGTDSATVGKSIARSTEAETAEQSAQTESNPEAEAVEAEATETEAPEDFQEEAMAESGNETAGNTVVVFFSVTGNTEALANKVATATGAPLMRIEPEIPYTSEDIDYNSDCRANHEQDSVTDRPAIAQPQPDISEYDTIYLGYPIWWGKVPRIMLTYVESLDLDGKTVIPFCTSGSSGIGGSLPELEAAAPSATWQDGQRFANSVSQSEIDSWVASFE